MGWLFGSEWGSAKAVSTHLRKELESSGYTVLDEASTSYGRHYWALIEKPASPEKGTAAVTPTIVLALISSNTNHGEKWFGYKDMDESMGPYESDCPLRLLDKAGPPPNEYAATWRLGVREYWAVKAESRATAKALAKGDKVWLKNTRDNPFTIASVTPKLRGYGASGMIYRLPKTRIERVEKAATS